jgi:anhydro-N-acetylmuramic acid kinase
MPNRWLIGLASGSTLDGVDAALVEGDRTGLDMRLRLVHALHQAYPRDVRDLLARVGAGSAACRQACLLHRLLGETFAAVARQVADQASFSLQKVQVIGCPGHTIWHEPEGRYPSTLALGIPAVVAERTGVTTVSDFSPRDMVLGGQGTPITSLIDYMVFGDNRETRILVHLGGMATVVYLPAGGGPRQVLGFQAGPCNVLLDGLIQRLTGGRETYDPGGKHAVQGRCIEVLLERWLAHATLLRRPPRSLQRQGFGEEFILQALQQARQNQWSLHDLLCTATHFVAQAITIAVQRFLPAAPQRVLLSGGGVRNGLLWHLLEQQFMGMTVEKVDHHGFPSASRKAVAFAGLAALTLDGVPANLVSATGASGTRLLGSLTPGSSANWARCVAWMAHQTAGLAAA